jgi:predicted Zn-dependent protease
MNRINRRRFLGSLTRVSGGLAAAAFFSGCKTMEALTGVAASTGVIDAQQAGSINKSAAAVAKSFEDFTPEQEYYIGRTVGVHILKKYPPYKNRAANEYVNTVGQLVARASEVPETYGGYHFLIQDSQQINALAAPGGLIFLTRGLIRCCGSEDALAAVLAHEVAHVQNKHGLQAIKKSRITNALTTIGVESARTFGDAEVGQLVDVFGDSVKDITKTLIDKGYSRSFEHRADKDAVTILRRVGYDPNGLLDMLVEMDQRLVEGTPDFASTHPSPKRRIDKVLSILGNHVPVNPPDSRRKRFRAAVRLV